MADVFSVKLSCVRCVDTIHSLTSILYLVRLVFFMPNLGGDVLCFVCETLFMGLVFCRQMINPILILG